jgi:hypothetical protein
MLNKQTNREKHILSREVGKRENLIASPSIILFTLQRPAFAQQHCSFARHPGFADSELPLLQGTKSALQIQAYWRIRWIFCDGTGMI